jgi:cell division transport system ATP-binding protein
MQLLARINAGGTTVVMATHEAGFVDQMQRRVIELVDGEMVRDESHGGYGDTSGLPSLAPEPERGAAAVAALTAVLEVHRETALSPSTAVSSAHGHSPTVAVPVAGAADAPAEADTTSAVLPDDAPVVEKAAPPAAAPAPRPAAPVAAAPRTQPVPVVDIAEVEVAELGLADRLGLGEADPDDEVGPTS